MFLRDLRPTGPVTFATCFGVATLVLLPLDCFFVTLSESEVESFICLLVNLAGTADVATGTLLSLFRCIIPMEALGRVVLGEEACLVKGTIGLPLVGLRCRIWALLGGGLGVLI